MTLAQIQFSEAAQQNIDETGADYEVDLYELRTGRITAESLLAHCLDGAGEDREQGWRDYVAALVAAGGVEQPVPTTEETTVTREKATELGKADGYEAASAVCEERGVDALRRHQSPGHVDWDEGAINAQAHATRGVPEALKGAYYSAYSASANATANRLIREADRALARLRED